MNRSFIKKISPLYSYWNSEQTDEDEKARLLIANTESKSVDLFKNEPYKWEGLFQCISREIIKGDEDSIKGMIILLSTISLEAREKVINSFDEKGLVSKSIIQKLNSKEFEFSKTKTNYLRFFKILLVIFINPYGINMKRKKKHIYENSGAFIGSLLNRLPPNLLPK